MDMVSYAKMVCMGRDTSWDYPPGAEHDKNAPYNQPSYTPDYEQVSAVLATIGELEEMMDAEECLQQFIPRIRLLFDEVHRIKTQIEDGEYR